MNKRFEGKIILVTGGNSGIGLAAAKRLAQEGARVIVTGRDRAKLDRAVAEIGAGARAIAADVSRAADVDRTYAEIKQTYGRLDGIFANAGIAVMEPVEAVTEATIDALMDANIKGTFFTIQKAIPLFARGAAVVINASALDAKGQPLAVVYGATKAAVRSMARTFTAALLDRDVRVNVVSPGPIETPIWDGLGASAIERSKNLNPMKRFGTADEVAAAVAFMLSDESSFTAGAELYVDGGSTQL